MLRTLAIGTLILAGASAVAHADVYRWVDEHGSVHYSDQWMPGSELIKTTRPRTPNATASAASQRSAEQQKLTVASDHASAQLTQEKDERAVQQDVAKARQQQCKEAKERYEKVIQARRIFKSPAKDGKEEAASKDREYLSDEQADAYRLQTHKDMVEACGSSSK